LNRWGKQRDFISFRQTNQVAKSRYIGAPPLLANLFLRAKAVK
jgi:hypothetical protein